MQDNSWRLGRLLGRALGGGLGSLKPLLESLQNLSWRALGELLEAYRAVLEALGEPWGPLGRAGGGPEGVLGGPGAVLEAYKRRLGCSLSRLGAVLEPSWELLGSS